MGLSELERLHAQMDGILKGIGYSRGAVGERMNALAKDPKYQFPDGDKGRARSWRSSRNASAGIRSQMPRAFNTARQPAKHGSQAPAARGGARRSSRVRGRRVHRRENPRTLLDKP